MWAATWSVGESGRFQNYDWPPGTETVVVEDGAIAGVVDELELLAGTEVVLVELVVDVVVVVVVVVASTIVWPKLRSCETSQPERAR